MRITTSASVHAFGTIILIAASSASAQTLDQTSISPEHVEMPAGTGSLQEESARPEAEAPGGSKSADAPTAADAGEVEEVVVTGSRIARRDYTSDTPITTVSEEAIASAGSATLETSLNQLPQVAASAGSQASLISRAGQASINLRGLGQQRTLVLVNGRRMQPSGNDGTVDLNVIPSSLIDSVEVITGGASATYGSDAVAGVVNLKLKKHFNGAELEVGAGETDKGDGANQNVMLTIGSDFAEDRGNAYLSLSYANRDSISFLDRDYLRGQAYSSNSPGGLIAASATNLPTQTTVDAVFARYGVAAGTVGRTSALSLNPDGTLYLNAGAVNFRSSQSSLQSIYNNTVLSTAGDYFLAQVPLERYSIFSHADYALSDSVSIFAEGLFTNYSVTTQANPVVVGSVSSAPLSIPVTNPFVSADLAEILASRPNPNAPFNFAQIITPVGNRMEKNQYGVFQLTVGADGRLDALDLSWNIYGSFGRTELLQTEVNFPSSVALQRLANAVDGGRSLCEGGYDFNRVDTLSQSCVDYIRRIARNTTVLEQTVVEATVQRRLLSLPAGEVLFVMGADYRSNTYDYAPDALIQTGELANYLPILPSDGEASVREIFGELLIPIVSGLPFAQDVSLNLGYRRSDYETVGGVNTYRADSYWKVNDIVGLRGGYARAVRAPSVGDLYAASANGLTALGTPGPIGSGDPCDVRSAYRAAGSPNADQIRTLCLEQGVPAAGIDTFTNTVSRTPYTTTGNIELEPEVSDTYSAGLVLKSQFQNEWLSRLTASIDYYNIRLKGAIGSVTNTVATTQCFNAASNPTFSNSNYYCGLISRDPSTGLAVNISNPLLNLGSYSTSGIDFQTDWALPLRAVGLGDSVGTVSLGVVVNYLDTFKIQTLPTGPTLDYAGTIGNTQVDFFATAHPEWKGSVTAGWSIGPVQSFFKWRYLGEMDNANNVGTGGVAHGVPSVSYFDLDFVWNVNDTLQLRTGAVNITGKEPPVLNDSLIGQTRSDLYTYDLAGRRFYVSLKARF